VSGNDLPRLCRRCGQRLRVNHSRDTVHCRECITHARKPAFVKTDFQAACHSPEHDPDWWWPETANDSCIPIAVAICFQCPVVDKCLAYAIEAREREGIWGGTTPIERRQTLLDATR
jgi:WhiB family redox-sensing transcriptional regulator